MVTEWRVIKQLTMIKKKTFRFAVKRAFAGNVGLLNLLKIAWILTISFVLQNIFFREELNDCASERRKKRDNERVFLNYPTPRPGASGQ